MPSGYVIADEPRPSPLRQASVNPMWPLLGLMLGGPWLAWPWFLLNGLAIGSATRRREGVLVALALFGSLGLAVGITALFGAKVLGGTSLKFALLGLLLWKLAMAYLLYTVQARSFAIYEYYSGAVWNGGLIVAIAASALRPRVLALLGGGLWTLVLG